MNPASHPVSVRLIRILVLFFYLPLRLPIGLLLSAFPTNIIYARTASVVLWSEFLATDPEVPGSIPGVTRFSEK
jgi:cytochrome c oxidase assembly factor CtaG